MKKKQKRDDSDDDGCVVFDNNKSKLDDDECDFDDQAVRTNNAKQRDNGDNCVTEVTLLAEESEDAPKKSKRQLKRERKQERLMASTHPIEAETKSEDSGNATLMFSPSAAFH